MRSSRTQILHVTYNVVKMIIPLTFYDVSNDVYEKSYYAAHFLDKNLKYCTNRLGGKPVTQRVPAIFTSRTSEMSLI